MNLRLVASIGIICACLAGTVAVAAIIHNAERKSATATGEEIHARVAAQVSDIVASTEQGLSGTSALFDASGEVGPDEFSAFNRHLLAAPTVTTIAFLEAVDADERAAWEERNGVTITDVGGEPGTPAGTRERYFPTTLIETEAADPVFGIDLASSPVRHAAIELAINGTEPILTPPIDLVSGVTGLVMFEPVYEGGAPLATVAERRAAIAGVVLGVYRTNTLGESIGRALGRGGWVEIMDGGKLVTAVGRRNATDDGTLGGVNVVGRRWTLRTGPTPDANAWPAIGAGAAGLAITLVIAALLLALSRRERYANYLVDRRLRERDEAEHAKAESEQRYQTLVSAMSDGLIVQNRDGEVLASNTAAQRILGLTEEEVMNVPLPPGAQIIDEAGTALDLSEWPSMVALRSGRSHRDVVVGIDRGHDAVTWLSVSVEPLVAEGATEPHSVVSCFSDITDRVLAGEELRKERDHWATLIDAMQDGMIHTDADGVITEVNPRFCEMTGFAEQALIGARAPYPFWPEDNHALLGFSGDLIDGRGAELDASYRRADGTTLPVIIAASPLFDTDGVVTGTVRTVKDSTERDRMDRAKDEFVSVVSHELRTPLTSIHGAIGVLAEGKSEQLDDTGRHILDIAHRNTERLSHLINHVLDLEQINAGKERGDFGAALGGELLSQAADLLGPLARENSVAFEIVPSADELTVYCDADRIAQVLTNFLSNAIKFSPAQSTVTLSCGRVGTEIQFRVRDRGRGIPPDQIRKIFERFHQVDSSDRRNVGGAGLGLAISHKIAELHGGRVWAESAIGKGSTFVLALPTSARRMNGSAPDSAPEPTPA